MHLELDQQGRVGLGVDLLQSLGRQLLRDALDDPLVGHRVGRALALAPGVGLVLREIGPLLVAYVHLLRLGRDWDYQQNRDPDQMTK